jgi:hypothetical protein
VTGDGQVFMPETESPQLNVTVTLVWFQLVALGGGVCVAVMVGGGGSVIAAIAVADPVAVRPSLTESVTVKFPAVA